MTKTQNTESQNEIQDILDLLRFEGIENNDKILDLFEIAENEGRGIELHNTYNDGTPLHNYYLIKRLTVGNRFFTMVEVGTEGDPRFCAYEPIIAFETEDDAPLYIYQPDEDEDGFDTPHVGFVY